MERGNGRERRGEERRGEEKRGEERRGGERKISVKKPNSDGEVIMCECVGADLMAVHMSRPIRTQFLAWEDVGSGRPDTQ